MGSEGVPMYPQAQEQFEKWLVMKRGFKREMLFCRTCGDRPQKCIRIHGELFFDGCGHYHNGGCIKLYHPLLDTYHPLYGGALPLYTVDWYYTSDGQCKRAELVFFRVGFDWLELLYQMAQEGEVGNG